MNKINRVLVLLLAPLVVLLAAGCPSPDQWGASSTSMVNNAAIVPTPTPTPPVAVKAWATCPYTKFTITFSADFGAVKTLEIYQAAGTGPFTKIATLTNLPGTTTYYTIRLSNGTYDYYVKALRSLNNTWYTSKTVHYWIQCSSGSSSASSGPF